MDAAARGKLGALTLLPVGAVMAQSHLGAALLVVLVSVSAFALAVIRRGHDADRRVPWRWWGGGALITVLMWIPPLVQQFRGPGPGNLGLILTKDLPAGYGVVDGVRITLDMFSVPPFWADPATMGLLPGGRLIPWLLLVPIAASVAAIRSRKADHVRFLLLGGVSLVALVGSVARISDPFAYLVTWGPTVAMVLVAGSVWIILDSVGRERWLTWAAPALLVIPALALALNLISNPAPQSEAQEQMEAVLTVAREHPDQGVFLSEWHGGPGPRTNWINGQMNRGGKILPGIAAVLQEQGIPVAVEVNPLIPSQRAKSLLPSDPEGKIPLVLRPLMDGSDAVPKGWRVIAEKDPFTAEEWARMLADARIIDDRGSDPVERVSALMDFHEVRSQRLAWQLLTPISDDEPASGSGPASR